MGHAYEKRMARLQAQQHATGRTPVPVVPMHRQSREAFLRGFGLSAAAVKQVVERWEADVSEHYDDGFADGVQYAEEQNT